MQIGVLANDQQWAELNNSATVNDCVRIYSQDENLSEIDALLVLEDIVPDFRLTAKPIILNAVSITLNEMNAPSNVMRINAWNSFIQRPKWEVAGQVTKEVLNVFSSLGKKETIVDDKVGFVAARIISMIINEAYYALADSISTKEEIDIAMRLGTNYPYGPFEWALLIGREKVFTLLSKLSRGETRYQPASLLEKEATL